MGCAEQLAKGISCRFMLYIDVFAIPIGSDSHARLDVQRLPNLPIRRMRRLEFTIGARITNLDPASDRMIPTETRSVIHFEPVALIPPYVIAPTFPRCVDVL